MRKIIRKAKRSVRCEVEQGFSVMGKTLICHVDIIYTLSPYLSLFSAAPATFGSQSSFTWSKYQISTKYRLQLGTDIKILAGILLNEHFWDKLVLATKISIPRQWIFAPTHFKLTMLRVFILSIQREIFQSGIQKIIKYCICQKDSFYRKVYSFGIIKFTLYAEDGTLLRYIFLYTGILL